MVKALRYKPVVRISIPDGVIASGRTMALGSTHPLREMSTGVFPSGKGDRCVRLTILPPSCAVVMKSGNLNFLEPSGPLQARKGASLLLIINKDATKVM